MTEEIWKNCEDLMNSLALQKQQRIEQIIEEVTMEKYEKLAELKASYEFVLKRLDKQKEKAEAKRKERDEEVKLMQEQMEAQKK